MAVARRHIYRCRKCGARVVVVMQSITPFRELEATIERKDKEWCLACVGTFNLRAQAFPRNEAWLRQVDAFALRRG